MKMIEESIGGVILLIIAACVVGFLYGIALITLAITGSDNIVSADGGSIGGNLPDHDFCEDRFHYTAFLQGVVIHTDQVPNVFFPDCPELSMDLTFRGSEIESLSWTLIWDGESGLEPVMAGVITSGPNAINFGHQYIPDVDVAIMVTNDPELQSALAQAFVDRSNETIFVGSLLSGFREDDAGNIQAFAVWIDIHTVEEFIVESVAPETIPDPDIVSADCQEHIFLKTVDVSTGAIYFPGDILVIPAGSQKDLSLEVGEMDMRTVTLFCPG